MVSNGFRVVNLTLVREPEKKLLNTPLLMADDLKKDFVFMLKKPGNVENSDSESIPIQIALLGLLFN